MRKGASDVFVILSHILSFPRPTSSTSYNPFLTDDADSSEDPLAAMAASLFFGAGDQVRHISRQDRPFREKYAKEEIRRRVARMVTG